MLAASRLKFMAAIGGESCWKTAIDFPRHLPRKLSTSTTRLQNLRPKIRLLRKSSSYESSPAYLLTKQRLALRLRAQPLTDTGLTEGRGYGPSKAIRRRISGRPDFQYFFRRA